MVGDVAPPGVGLSKVGFFEFPITTFLVIPLTCHLHTLVLLFGARAAIDCIIACV